MAYITRWNPYRDMAIMRRNMDHLMDNFVNKGEDLPKTVT